MKGLLALILFCNVVFASLPELQNGLLDVVQQKEAALVRVNAVVRDPDNGDKNLLRMGTGFFIEDGLIVTNANSVFSANRIWIDYKGRSYEAVSLGSDLITNVAVLKTKEKIAPFLVLQNTDITMPPVGSFLVSLSFKMGLNVCPTLGLATGHNIEYVGNVWPTTFLRSNIPSEGGDGGAPVFDIRGNWVGMMIISLPEFRSSYTVPVRALRRIVDDIVFTGTVNYAFVGIDIDFNSKDLVENIVISNVVKNSPAEKSGLLKDDVLISIGAFTIRTREDLLNAFFFTRPNESLPVEVERNGKKLTCVVHTEAKKDSR
ncbi:MAG: hypothetical protein A2Y14_03165 [Verrucomicrobia bacterium GWF2_51_19]|nr:MAG: hypothetical protein A2Y14_03165 [Verrucomicrobia bacterium GWF2_51_19]HCJ12365.1 hypothetical protein [Opitutae bacterium]